MRITLFFFSAIFKNAIRIGILKVCFISLLLTGIYSGNLKAGSIELTSDEPIEFEQTKAGHNQLIAKGNAELKGDQFLVRADEIWYSKERQEAEAIGNVQLTRGKFRVVGEKVRYSIAEESFKTDHLRLGAELLLLEGNALSGNARDLTLENGIIYFGEPDELSIRIKAKEIQFDPNEYFLAKKATLYIGKIPLFYLPYYKQSMHKMPFRIKSGFGYRNDLGIFMRNTVFYNMTESINPGVLVDYYSKRGWLAGPALEYGIQGQENVMKGSSTFAHIRDHGSQKTDIRGKKVPEDRFFLEWRHRQLIGEKINFVGSASWWSDSDVERDFRPGLFENNQQPDNYFEAVYRGKNYFLSAFTRFRPNDFQLIQERLPEIRFDRIPTPIGETKIYSQTNTSFTVYRQKKIDNTHEQSGNVVDFYQSFLRPLSANSTWTLLPTSGIRVLHFSDAHGIGGDYTRVLGQLGADLQGNFYGAWDRKSKTWKIDGIRHVLRPLVRYRYIPSKRYGKGQLPPMDTNSYGINLNPIDLGNRRDWNNFHSEHKIRFGLENSLQTRHSGYGSRELATLNIYQDFHIEKKPREKTWSDCYTELDIMPAHWLGFTIYNRIDPKTLTMQELRCRTRIVNGDAWTLYFGTENLHHVTDQYLLELDIHLTSRHTVRGKWRFDAHRDQFVEQFYALRTLIGHTWGVEYYISLRRGAVRESYAQYGVRFDLLQF